MNKPVNFVWPEILAYENTLRCWISVKTDHVVPSQSFSYCLTFLRIHVDYFNTILVFDFDPKTIIIFFLQMILQKESKTDCISYCLRQQHTFWKT